MAIRLDPEATDAQGLPVVSWEEDRNLFAPGGISPARVSCFLRPDRDSGELQFVSVGLVRHGEYEKARPWQKLISFGSSPADQHYYSATDQVIRDTLASKSKSGVGRLLATDGAHVMLANFADERSSIQMHLNCADCAPVEMALLHDRLEREFIRSKTVLLRSKCDSDYVWPKDKPFMPHTPQVQAAVPRWMVRVIDAIIVVMLGLAGWGFYWLVVR